MPTRTKPVGFVGVVCCPSHCSLTMALVEDTTVAVVEYLESRMSVPITGMDGCVGTWAAGALGHVISPLPAFLCPPLRWAHRLVVCVSTASPCPSARHVSVLGVEGFLLQSHREKFTLERTAAGHLDEPPAQSQAEFRIIIFKNLQEQRLCGLSGYLSGLTRSLGKETWVCSIVFKPSHEWVGDTN